MSCTLSLRAKNMTIPDSKVAKSHDIPSSVVAPNTPPAPMMSARIFISQIVRFGKGILRTVITRKQFLVRTANQTQGGSTMREAIVGSHFCGEVS
jgi:hypothetical protein